MAQLLSSVLGAGVGGLLGGVLLSEALSGDRYDDNRGYGDLQHYFTVLPFYSCPCLSIQTTTVISKEMISEEMTSAVETFKLDIPTLPT